jgi:hypothetical protein
VFVWSCYAQKPRGVKVGVHYIAHHIFRATSPQNVEQNIAKSHVASILWIGLVTTPFQAMFVRYLSLYILLSGCPALFLKMAVS